MVQYKRNCSKIRVMRVESALLVSSPVGLITEEIDEACRQHINRIHWSSKKINYVEFYCMWVFTLSKHYRLNLTFEHLHFSMANHYPCEVGSMIINSVATNDKFEIKYCGVHSVMNIFPPHSNATINTIVRFAATFSISLSYSITDSYNMFSISSLKHDLTNTNKWTIYFLKSHIYLKKFMLRVKSYQYLVINVTGCNNCSIKFHDGPDFQSPSLKPISLQKICHLSSQ